MTGVANATKETRVVTNQTSVLPVFMLISLALGSAHDGHGRDCSHRKDRFDQAVLRNRLEPIVIEFFTPGACTR